MTFNSFTVIITIYNYKEKFALKKITALILLILCLLFSSFGVYAEETSTEEEQLTIYGGCKAVVYNPQTGTYIFEQDGDDRTEPATSAKMTAVIIIYDHFSSNLYKEITVESKHIRSVGSPSNPATPMIGIKAGNVYTVEELIKAACVSWANDAVNVLIHAYCEEKGIEYDDFSDIMTEYAEGIGCEDTRYREPLGKNELGSRTSARDVALICAEFYNRYDLLTASSQAYYILQGSTIHTRNYLLSERIMAGNYLKNARGFFAGQVHAAGDYCVATSVENGPLTYIVVVLDGCMYLYDEEGNRYFDEGKNPYTDVKALVNWSKDRYNYFTLCRAGDALDEILLEQGKNSDHIVVCAKDKIEAVSHTGDDLSGLEIKIIYDTDRVYTVTGEDGKTRYAVKAPITKGEILGMAEFTLNGNFVGSTQLLAADSIDTDTVVKFFETVESMLFSSTAKTILTVILVLVGLYILYCVAAFTVRVVKKVKKDANDTKKEQKLKELKERKNKK